MAALENEGYLIQPNTSAGRIPSQKGYRYYIDNLMEKTELNPRFTQYADSFLRKRADVTGKCTECSVNSIN